MLRLLVLLTISFAIGCDTQPPVVHSDRSTGGSVAVLFRGETLNAIYATRFRGEQTSRSEVLIVLADVDASVFADRHGFTTIGLKERSIVVEGRPLVLVISDAGILVSAQQLGESVDDREAITEWVAATLGSMSDMVPSQPAHDG